MGLFSFLRKKDSTDDSAFDSRSAEEGGARGRSRKRQKANEPVDPVLPEKRRARRRLVGAIALVLAAVIVLPMVLDPEPKPLAHNISIDIPSKDKTHSSARTADAGVPAAATLDNREELVNPDNLPASQATAAAGSKDIAPDPRAVATVDAKSDDKTNAAVGAKPADKPQAGSAAVASVAPVDARAAVTTASRTDVRPDAKVSDEARARALLAGKPDPAVAKVKPETEKPERYVVQVAALTSPEKVRELQNKLKAAGIQSHTQKVAIQPDGQVIRVRVGPVGSRPDAEKLRAKLVKLGLNGTLVPV